MASTSIGARNQYSTAVSGGAVTAALFPMDIPDWRDKMERTDVPLQKMMGTAGAPSKAMHKAEWGWSSPDPFSDTVTEAVAAIDLTITVANGSYYQVGDVLSINDEELRVTDRASNVLTVTRAFAGTTAAAHDDNDVVINLGPAVVESADDADSPYTQGDTDYNFHQILTFTWSMSNRADKTWNYEHRDAGLFQDELKKKMRDTAPIRFELRFLKGRRAQGTGTTPSAFGGLREPTYITTRNDLATEPLTEVFFMDTLQEVNNLVGPSLAPKDIACSHFTARIISSWYNETRRSSMSDSKAKVNWTSVETDFGTVKIHPHYLMDTVAPTNMYIADFSEFKIRPYASGTGWQTGEHTTQGWYRRGYLRGDYTVLAELCDARAEIYGYSVTAGDYAGLS